MEANRTNVHPYLGVVDVQSLPVQQIRQSLSAIPHDDPLSPKHGEYCNNAKKSKGRAELNHLQSRDVRLTTLRAELRLTNAEPGLR
jgi:hypothetical protein